MKLTSARKGAAETVAARVARRRNFIAAAAVSGVERTVWGGR